MTHQCTFLAAVNWEKGLGQSETKLCVTSCEDIGSKILNVEVLSMEVLIISLEATLASKQFHNIINSVEETKTLLNKFIY